MGEEGILTLKSKVPGDLPALGGLTEAVPGPPGQGFVIRQAEIIAQSCTVEQPESELRLVSPIPGEPSFNQTWEASTHQPDRGFEDWIKYVSDGSPEPMSKGQLLHKLQHQNTHERGEGVLDEEAEPIPGDSASRPECSGRGFAMTRVTRIVRQPQGRLHHEQRKEKNSKGMTMDGVLGCVPPVRRRAGQLRMPLQTRWQGRGHASTDATKDADSDAAEDAHQEGHEKSLLGGIPQDFAHPGRYQFGRPI